MMAALRREFLYCLNTRRVRFNTVLTRSLIDFIPRLDVSREAECRAISESEEASMTYVALGLLIGMLGLLWLMIIAIMQADHQTERQSPRAQDKSPVKTAHCESKVA